MKCTEFMKGVAVGMIAGGAVVFFVMPRKKHCGGMAGRVLKCAGHMVENISDAFGL